MKNRKLLKITFYFKHFMIPHYNFFFNKRAILFILFFCRGDKNIEKHVLMC
jgi:hypothetical protein